MKNIFMENTNNLVSISLYLLTDRRKWNLLQIEWNAALPQRSLQNVAIYIFAAKCYYYK